MQPETEFYCFRNGTLVALESDENEVAVYTSFSDFGPMQKALEEKGITIISAELDRIPATYAEVDDAQRAEVMKMIEKIEEDEDVQNVFHNMREEE